MILLDMFKHSFELVVALLVCYIGAVMLSPGAGALAKVLADDGSSGANRTGSGSGYGYGYRSGPSWRCYGGGGGMIRPSMSFRCRR